MLTSLCAQDRVLIEANNWRAKKLLSVLPTTESYARDLLIDILAANHEILEEKRPSHIDSDTLPNPDAEVPPNSNFGAGAGRRVALFVGHTKGTGATSYRGEDEWTTRNRVAVRAQKLLEARGHVVGVFYRDGRLGYTAAMREHGATARNFGAIASLELHFNCYNGTAEGAEILVWSQKTAETLGAAFIRATREFYPRRKLRGGGVKVQTTGRGSGFNRFQPCPSGVYEPAFADNPRDWDDYWQDANVEREAAYIATILEEFFA